MTSVLFLGGAGMIGSAVAAEAVRRGMSVTVVTRGAPRRSLPDGVVALRADVRDAATLAKVLGGREYDAVVNWVGYTPADLAGHAELFPTGQYVFVSTCSVYARPVPLLPITESSPRSQPAFGYARDKLACERLLESWYDKGFPVTIARPFHTYDRTVVPLLAGWTAVARMRAGRPVVVHGDGTSLWCLTHADDVARAMVGLLGNGQAVGESVNVVGGTISTWDQIHRELAVAAGVPDAPLVHRASETIATEIPGWADVLAEDFRHSMLFDTTKLTRLVPGFAPRVSLSAGLREVVAHHDAVPPAVNVELDAAFDRLAAGP
jgi:nucleoside-diphosphate-sugar epimerase